MDDRKSAVTMTVASKQKPLRRGEGGQMLIVGALFIMVIAGGAAIAVDTGAYMSHRRSLQNDADAIALAASQGLPDTGDAQDLAIEWAELNGVEPGSMALTITPQSLPNEPNPKIKVELTANHSLSFLRLLGRESAEVNVSAVAVITSPGGGNGIMPWSVLEEDKEGSMPGDTIVLKYDASHGGNFGPGNFGALRLDGNGGSDYEDAIKYGSENTFCAVSATNCTDPSVVSTKPGNMTGPTEHGVTYRMNNTSSACDTWGEVIFENADGLHMVNPSCNPWADGSNPSLRVVVIPVIDQACNGTCDVTIVEFALFFLDGYGDDGCSGNSCEIEGRFIRSNTNYGALIGTYDADTYVHFVRLVN